MALLIGDADWIVVVIPDNRASISEGVLLLSQPPALVVGIPGPDTLAPNYVDDNRALLDIIVRYVARAERGHEAGRPAVGGIGDVEPIAPRAGYLCQVVAGVVSEVSRLAHRVRDARQIAVAVMRIGHDARRIRGDIGDARQKRIVSLHHVRKLNPAPEGIARGRQAAIDVVLEHERLPTGVLRCV